MSLVLDVAPDHIDRSTAAAAGEVAGRPESSVVGLYPDSRVAVLAKQPAGNAFEAVHQGRYRDLRRVGHQKVDMVGLAVELHKARFKILADLGEDALQDREGRRGKYLASVFRQEDQMNMQVKNTMPAVSCILE